MKHLLLILLLYLIGEFVAAQPNSQRFSYSVSADSLLDLLPDKASYMIIQDQYIEDSLVANGVAETFYNYGDTRYCFYHKVGTRMMQYFMPEDATVYRMTKYQVLNDSLTLQTKTNFHSERSTIDSLLVYSKMGRIYKSESRVDGKPIMITYYYYSGNNLIERRVHSGKDVLSKFKYAYRNDTIVGMEIESSWFGNSVSEIEYLDSIINIRSWNTTRTILEGLTRCTINKDGNLRKTETFSGQKLNQMTTYEYLGENELTILNEFAGSFSTETKHIFKDDILYQTVVSGLNQLTGQNERLVRTYSKL